MKRRALLAVVLMASLLPYLGPRLAQACAPVFAVAVFHYKRHPDLPRDRFIRGNLGVIQPTWARSYLVLSYRYLAGVGLDDSERDQVRDYFKDRDTQWWDRTGNDWPARWKKLRDRVPGIAHPDLPELTAGQYAFDEATNSFTLNCAEDAYRTAVYTLADRTRRFGLRSAAVRDWTAAQNAVFANCGRGETVIPAPAAAGLPPLIQADRAYQTAAAYFYAGDDAEARRRFAAIGEDAQSPWSTISRYLVVRTLVRASEKGIEPELIGEGQANLADPKLASIHSITANLLDRSGVKQHDLTYFHLLGNLLARRGEGAGLRDALWNYTQLYDHFLGESDPNPPYPADRSDKPADPAPFAANSLSLWIFHMQRSVPASPGATVALWQRTKSLPWLVAALTHATPTSAATPGLLEAAQAAPESSPAYFSIRYHLNRLRIESGDRQAAREEIDRLLASPKLDASSASRFRDLRLLAAPSLADFLQFAVRRPLLITDTEDIAEVPLSNQHWEYEWLHQIIAEHAPDQPRLSEDAAQLVNRELPQRLLAEAALTRAMLLEQDAEPLAAQLAVVDAKLAPYTKPYLDAATAADGRFAAAFLLLHQPEAHPYVGAGISRETAPGRLDSYRDNWWCPLERAPAIQHAGYWQGRFEESRRQAPPGAPAFLSRADSAEAAAEIRSLSRQPSSVDFLGGIVLGFAGGHPDDPRVPEALHLVVRGARVSCAGRESWKTTRAAFRMLHARYPKTSWARKTPTWWRDYAFPE
jgi:hypothetical protein